MEGVAHSIAHALSAYDAVGESPERIIAVGGGTKNPIFLQSVTDITGSAQTVALTDGAALGDAALAAHAVGRLADRDSLKGWVQLGEKIEADPTRSVVLRDDHQDYLELYRSLTDLNARRMERLHAR
jgi:xylulokinase